MAQTKNIGGIMRTVRKLYDTFVRLMDEGIEEVEGLQREIAFHSTSRWYLKLEVTSEVCTGIFKTPKSFTLQ